MTLTEFLTARLDEDEAMARRAHDTAKDWVVSIGFGLAGMSGTRVLREVEAKRRIVALAVEQGRMLRDDWDEEVEGAVTVMRQTLHLLALPYADHPDYDEAWRP